MKASGYEHEVHICNEKYKHISRYENVLIVMRQIIRDFVIIMKKAKKYSMLRAQI